jgi:hypothetical protein
MTGVPNPDPKLMKHLTTRGKPLVDLVLALREIVLTEVPAAHELVVNVSYALALNYSFTVSVKEAFCGIVVYREHCNLSFYQGSQIADPQKHLIGDGKLQRHLQFKSPDDLKRPYIREFLQAAAEQAEKERPQKSAGKSAKAAGRSK